MKCIFCDTDNNPIVIQEHGFNGVQCRLCGLIYIDNPPSNDQIVKRYANGHATISPKAHLEQEFANRLVARHHLSILRRYMATGDMLELGPGAGHFLDEARKLGYAPCAIELNRFQAAYIVDFLHIPCETEPFSQHSFGGRQFDVIYHCDVMSHFSDPIGIFDLANRALKPSGIVFFETGGGDVDISQSQKRSDRIYQYPDHLFFYNTRNLKELLTRTGFELLNIHRYSLEPQNFFYRLRSYIEPAKSVSAMAAIKRSPEEASRAPIRNRTILHAYMYLMFFLRYRLGSIATKQNRAQTILVAARKK